MKARHHPTFFDIGRTMAAPVPWEVEPVYPDRQIRDSPERKLMRAVLEEAIRTIRRGPGTTRTPSRRGGADQLYARDPHAQAVQWVLADDTDTLFSFRSICTVLGLNPDYIRRRLPRARKPARLLHAVPPRAALFHSGQR